MDRNFLKIMVLVGMALSPLMLFQAETHAHDLVWPAAKLAALYPGAVSFEQKNLYVSDRQKAVIEKVLGTKLPEEDLKPSIYLAVIKSETDPSPRKAAAMIFIDSYGEGGKIEMGVVVNGKGELLNVHIFENRESPKISAQSFLGQFTGKRASDAFKVGADIKSPAGTEKSAQAIASGAKRGLLIVNEMFRKR